MHLPIACHHGDRVVVAGGEAEVGGSRISGCDGGSDAAPSDVSNDFDSRVAGSFGALRRSVETAVIDNDDVIDESRHRLDHLSDVGLLLECGNDHDDAATLEHDEPTSSSLGDAITSNARM